MVLQANAPEPLWRAQVRTAFNSLEQTLDKTVMDFGAVGDGVADDAPAFNAALAWSDANDVPAIVPNRTYRIAAPIAIETTKIHGTMWGLIGMGAKLVPDYSDTSKNFISVIARHYARYFTLSGLSLLGVRLTGHGIYLAGKEPPTNVGSLYNANLHDLTIEGFNDGLHVNGEVFESHFSRIYSRDNARDGFRFGHSASGICSAIYLNGFIAGGNGRYGVRTENSMTDLTASDGYILLNQSYGMALDQGTGKSISDVGFENNFLSAAFTESSAHIFTRNQGAFNACSGYNGLSVGAKYLLYKSAVTGGDMAMRDCRIRRSGAQATGLARLDGAGHTHLLNTYGDLTINSPALYTADFCFGAGLSTTGRVTNVP